MAEARVEIEDRAVLLAEKQKESIAERLLERLNEEDKSEMSNNIWLKREVRVAAGGWGNCDSTCCRLQQPRRHSVNSSKKLMVWS